MDYRLKCKTYYCKSLRWKHKRKLHNTGLDDNLLNVTPKTQETGIKIDKWDCNQKLSLWQKNNERNEKPVYWMGKTNLVTIYLIINYSPKCISNSENSIEKKIFSNAHFSKESIQMTKFIKRHSISLSNREMGIKSTVKYHFIPVRLAIFKINKQKSLVRMWRYRNLCALLVAM